MCFPGDVAIADEKLAEEPDPEEDRGRNRHNPDKDECHHLMARKKHQVGTHHTGDGARCSHQGNRDVRIQGDKPQRGRHTAEDVNGQVADRPKGFFYYVVPKNPQGLHVEQNMDKPDLKEHRVEHGCENVLLRKDDR